MKEASEILEGEVRLEMICLAIDSNPRFSGSDIEIKRKGNTYTYETLEELHEIYKEASLYFIMGADNLLSIEKWKCFEKVLKECIIIVASRGEIEFERIK